MNMDIHIPINVIFPAQIQKTTEFAGGELVVFMNMDIHIPINVIFPPQIRRALRRIRGGQGGANAASPQKHT